MDETAPTAPPTTDPLQPAPNLLHVDPIQAQVNANKMVKEMTDLRESVEQLKAKIAELEANVKKVDDKIESLNGELSELNEERKVLKDKENKLESLKCMPRDQWNAEDREEYRDRADLDASFANVIADKAALNKQFDFLNQRLLNLDNEEAYLREERKSKETKMNDLKLEYETVTGSYFYNPSSNLTKVHGTKRLRPETSTKPSHCNTSNTKITIDSISAITRKYKIAKLNPDFAPDLPNCSFAQNRITRVHVIIKKSLKKKEVDFLTLLSSPPYRTDPRNKTIQPIETFEKPQGVYWIVFLLLTPLRNTFYDVPYLSKETWLRYIKELREYRDFLHEHRICHSDIKPSNLAYDYDTNQLVVLDCDLMESYPAGKSVVATRFYGTEEWADPGFVRNPELGFNVFELDTYSVEKTCEWMMHEEKIALIGLS